jgi:hypothetical protein
MKKIIPERCPNCNTPLELLKGKEEGVLKLFCPNEKCEGSLGKKLEKGFAILNIKNIGPATIAKLMKIGVDSVLDIFDENKVNRNTLISSGEFKSGRQLVNILNSIKEYEKISIEKAINSLQLEIQKESGEGNISIGKSLSLQIGRLLSGLNYDFEGLSIQVREDIELKEKSEILNNIKELLSKFEKNGVKVIKIEERKQKETKKLKKKVSFDTKEEYKSILDKLEWEEVDVEESDLLVVDDKEQNSEKITKAKENAIKVITFKQLKILFL